MSSWEVRTLNKVGYPLHVLNFSVATPLLSEWACCKASRTDMTSEKLI